MLKVGILGGGQLGRMLLQSAANYQVETHVMENDEDCPSAYLCRYFIKGNIRDYDSVYHFGKNLDAITIEIENVNIDALETLEKEGVKIYPKPSVLKTIKSKALQKQFYLDHHLPTAEFAIIQSNRDIKHYPHLLPGVQKLSEGGYDGRGVQIINNIEEAILGFEAYSVLEKKINIKKEIAQIVAMGQDGKTAIYPAVEMVFNHSLNLLDYQICPADLPKEVLWKIEAISLELVRNLKSPGLFAVEFLIDKNNEVFINETAPRVHNSGHHTIEAHFSSQFDMLWRIILGLPLGNTQCILPSVMINLIGSEGFTGEPKYDGIDEILKMENAFVHIYGKYQTKPARKMGHVTILSNEKQELIHKANKVKQILTVVT